MSALPRALDSSYHSRHRSRHSEQQQVSCSASGVRLTKRKRQCLQHSLSDRCACRFISSAGDNSGCEERHALPGCCSQPRSLDCSRWQTQIKAAQSELQGAASVPLVEEISSLSNAYVKHCVKVRTNRSYREKVRSVIVAGAVPVAEVCEAGALVKVLFLAKGPSAPPSFGAERVVTVSPAVLQKLAGVESVDGLETVAEVAMPTAAKLSSGVVAGSPLRRLLVLDGLQDPGNMGTVLRTALALGWQAAYLLPGCCDPFNDKALRASRGAAFKLPLAAGDWAQLQGVLQAHPMLCLAAEPSVPDHGSSKDLPLAALTALADRRLCLVLGAEGQGLSNASLTNCTPVGIPMAGHMESLNVGVAGGIMMFVLSDGLPKLLSTLLTLLQ